MLGKNPPDSDGAYVGATRFHDGVVWTWNGAKWTTGRRPDVLYKINTSPPLDNDLEPESEHDH